MCIPVLMLWKRNLIIVTLRQSHGMASVCFACGVSGSTMARTAAWILDSIASCSLESFFQDTQTYYICLSWGGAQQGKSGLNSVSLSSFVRQCLKLCSWVSSLDSINNIGSKPNCSIVFLFLDMLSVSVGLS